MRYEITNHAHSFTLTDDLKAFISEELSHLDPILKRFPEDATFLRVIIGDGGNAGGIQAQLRLSLPTTMLTSHESAPVFRTAFDIALKELRRQLIDHKEKLQDARERGR